MLILISQLIGRPVLTFDDALPVGVVRDPIIDPANGKLCGYFIGSGLFNLKQAVIAADDLVGYDPDRLIVGRPDVARQPQEEPKIRGILKKKILVYGAKVRTESGRALGRANDLLLDTELNMIVKYYVHGLLQDRIIAAEHVVAIDKRGIIVDDTAPTVGAVAAEA